MSTDNDGLYKPKGSKVWYGRFWDGAKSDWNYRSTRCRDRAAARIIRGGWEREAADPRAAAAARTTLSDAIVSRKTDLQSMANATPPRKSQRTVDFYEQKAGHLIRIFEHNDAGEYVPLKLSALEPPHGARLVDQYIARRRVEWAVAPKKDENDLVIEPGRAISDHTISKELICLRGTLKLAKRHGLWTGDIDAVMPVAFAPGYEPGDRWLTKDEAWRLIAELTPDRGARVALMIGAGAEWSATERAARGDAAEDFSFVHIRGSKRKTRNRRIPLVFQWQRDLVKFAFAGGRGAEQQLFEPWGNVNRDLARACLRAGEVAREKCIQEHGACEHDEEHEIDPCSPNDLRRTCMTWMRAEGMMPSEIAPFAGHADSRMVEKVYANLQPDQLRAVMEGRAALESSTGSSMTGRDLGFMARGTAPATVNFTREMAPRPGLEPGTHGLTVPSQKPLTSRKDERTIEVRRLALVRAAVGGKS